ncbi:MAG: PfkB family carbohydrate kinase [Brevinema sp.]
MNRKVLVIGSLNMDIFVGTERFPNEGETVFGNDFQTLVGGKGANQAAAIALQGIDVTMLGVVGNNEFGEYIIQELQRVGIKPCITQVDHPTGTAIIERNAQGQNKIIVVSGANNLLLPDKIDLKLIDEHDIIVLQFEIPIETITFVAHEAKKRNKIVVINPAPVCDIPEGLLQNTDFIVPNEHELTLMTGIETRTKAQIKTAVTKLPTHLQTIVTLGYQGVYFANQDQFIPAYPFKALDTSGAGDAFIGGFVGALAKGFTTEDAIHHANKVAGISVTKKGAFATAGSFEEAQKIMCTSIKKIAIICSSGVTSSLLAKKAQEVCDGKYHIESADPGILSLPHDYDIIFLSPQFSYEPSKNSSTIIKTLPANMYNILHVTELQFIIHELLED